MPLFDSRSEAFRAAVVRIQRRAERQELEERLTKSFVPTPLVDELQTDQNQLVFGRRGVGKTHTLKVYLGQKVQEGHLCSYVDCTSFGSGLSSDGSPKNVGVRFFSKLIYTLSNNLLEHVIRMEKATPESVNRSADILGQLSAMASPNATGETFNYSEINRLVRTFMVEIGSRRSYFIIDEWAQIPIPAQPYFAEFLKRSLFAARDVTVKIGVVDYAYRLSEQLESGIVGFEKSADIFSDVRMDRHFVWDEDPAFVEKFFALLLFNHIALELGVSADTPEAEKLNAVGELFTQDRSLSELCRASEGNARDFLVMFGRSHSDFLKQSSHERIGLHDVQRAAINWYREDKLANIATELGLEAFLQYLIDSVISKKRARAFMVPSQAIYHPLLRRLFSGRVLHPLNIEWSHPDKPGERYTLVSVDYGTYASFKGTRNEPREELFWVLNPQIKGYPDDLVPLKNDRRSIRRIVVDADTMDQFWNQNLKPQ